jgi:hypothetical protein
MMEVAAIQGSVCSKLKKRRKVDHSIEIHTGCKEVKELPDTFQSHMAAVLGSRDTDAFGLLLSK